jgi:trans-2,3-dihydro-3-hydroxyanthranilate isomerase
VVTCPYLRVDVFTDRPFGGNPLAVFPEAEGLDTATMQAIAREMNLSETVFCSAPTKPQADVRLRIFTVDRELPLAGHPTVGTAFALAASGRFPCSGRDAVLWCELGAGVLPVELELRDGLPVRTVMTQRRPAFGAVVEDLGLVARALGLPQRALAPGDLPVRVVDTGIPWLLIPIGDLAAIRQLRPDPVLCAQLAERAGTDLIHAFTQDVVDHACTAHARHVWFGTVTPGEDPATGSAAGCLGAYLVGEGVVLASPEATLSIEQGLEIGRPSRIEVRVTQKAGAVEVVQVGGRCVLLGEGELRF